MLDGNGADYTYREYTEEPLTVEELEAVFAALGKEPEELLRKRDAKPLGVTGDEPREELLALMAEHPTLLQRPILWSGERAVVGRPPEDLLELL